jgi:hypothetical protein
MIMNQAGIAGPWAALWAEGHFPVRHSRDRLALPRAAEACSGVVRWMTESYRKRRYPERALVERGSPEPPDPTMTRCFLSNRRQPKLHAD